MRRLAMTGRPVASPALIVLLAVLGLGGPLLSRPAGAQAVYGSIAGTVTDNSGAVLPGVAVTITSVQRQTADTVLTDENGRYTRERLLPGNYAVRAELQGFKLAVVPEVTVAVDTQTPVNFTMEVGQVAEEVTVTGGSPLLKTDRADVSTRFEQRQLTELPVLDRNATKFLLLTPGTQQLGWQHAASENPQGSVQIQVNGQHFSGTGYQLDGTENRDPILGIIVINPTLESLGEMKVTSQNYDAEFGQATAGVVSMQTKSGSNSFHGSAFEFYQDDAFQARNPFTQFQADPVTGKFIPDTTKHQYGGSIGGPIRTNRFFFFTDYQAQRDTQGGSRLLTVPTEAARRGDLSAYDTAIFDPQTGTPGAVTGRQAFPGGQIPANRLSPQAQAILSLIPLPNAPGRENGTRDNYIAAGSETFRGHAFNARVDGRLSDALNTFGRYSLGDYIRDGPTAFGTGGGQEIGNLGGVSDVRNHSLAYGIDYALSNSLLADFRFGFFRYNVDVLPFDFGTTPAADAGIPGLNLDTTFTSGLPAGFIEGTRGAFNFGSGLGVNRCNCPLEQDEKQMQFVGNVTKLLGSHTIKMGADVRRAYNLRVPSDRHRSGELTFSGNRTSGPTGGGLGLATFLLGDVTRFTRYVSPSTNARERQWRQFYYAQDTWRPHARFTVNYGLRLDVIHPQTVNEPGNGGWLDLDSGDILVGGVGGIGLNGDVRNRLNWAPRLGVTYQVDERTVLRAGYGRSYDIGVFGSLFGHSVTQNLPVLSVQELNAPSNFDDVFTLAEGPPPAVFPEVPSSGRFRLPNGVFSRALPEQQRPPALDAFNVTLQRQLTASMSGEVAYVGNRGRRVFAGDGPDVNVNQATLDGYLDGVPRDQRRPFFLGFKTPVENLGGPFNWTQDIAYFCNCANNWYDSLQAKLEQRLSGGYSYRVSYTLQKARGEGGEYFFFDRALNRGVQDWDRTHNLIVSLVAELPFGRGKPWGSNAPPVVDAILGGWQFNMNSSFLSGLPFNVGYNDSGQDRDTGPGRPDLIGDPEGPKTRAQWFNAAPIGASGSAFGRPARGTFGSLERNALRGPHLWQTDASLFKNVRFSPSHVLQLRVEAMNVFNQVNLGLPDTTVGVPGNPNPNAGRINSTASPQRALQFAARFSF
jgi:hypothetical protein